MVSSSVKARHLGIIANEMRKIRSEEPSAEEHLKRIARNLGDLYDDICGYDGERKMKDILIEKIFNES